MKEYAEKGFWANALVVLLAQILRDIFIFALSLSGLIYFDFWGFACSGGLILFSEILSIANVKKTRDFYFELLETGKEKELTSSKLPTLCTYASLTVLFISFLAVYL